jgi:large subunit ribosomal protein L21
MIRSLFLLGPLERLAAAYHPSSPVSRQATLRPQKIPNPSKHSLWPAGLALDSVTFCENHPGATVEEIMYAVFEDGSRQYRVSEGDVVKVDYRAGDNGARIEFGHVLLYQNGDDTRIGQPLIEGLRVLGEVVEQTSTKLYIQHFRRRKNYRRLRGHRQPYTRVRIRHILLPGQEPPAAPPPQPAPSATPPAS